MSEEPDALAGHVRGSGGPGGQPLGLPGPLYFGDKVIGVNTWKVVAVEIGGLNFAVHYAEVLEFLEANGIATGG
jgi:hypothetical protein